MTTPSSYYGGEPLTLLFRLDDPDQVEALHTFRAAFGAATEIEAVNENGCVLYIWPAHPGCPCDGEKRDHREAG
jgi:hypothetical protein